MITTTNATILEPDKELDDLDEEESGNGLTFGGGGGVESSGGGGEALEGGEA